MPNYKYPEETIHLGVIDFNEGKELLAVITNKVGEIVTLFKDPLVSRLELFQLHYPNLDLFEKLKVKRP